MKEFEAMPLDFETWSRENIVRLVQDLWAQNKQLRADNKQLHDAWRQEIRNKTK